LYSSCGGGAPCCPWRQSMRCEGLSRASGMETLTPPPDTSAPAHLSVDWNANTLQQLGELQRQNTDLQTAVREKDREFERFKRNAELQALTGGIRPSSAKIGGDQRDNKIVELAKKNRAASMELEKERTKSQTLAGELKRAQQALSMVQGGSTTPPTQSKGSR
jgi:predicted RNase H-like nuclease (RuvC/YqgF family)